MTQQGFQVSLDNNWLAIKPATEEAIDNVPLGSDAAHRLLGTGDGVGHWLNAHEPGEVLRKGFGLRSFVT